MIQLLPSEFRDYPSVIVRKILMLAFPFRHFNCGVMVLIIIDMFISMLLERGSPILVTFYMNTGVCILCNINRGVVLSIVSELSDQYERRQF